MEGIKFPIFTQYPTADIQFVGEICTGDTQLKVNSVEIVLKDMRLVRITWEISIVRDSWKSKSRTLKFRDNVDRKKQNVETQESNSRKL